MLDQSRMMNQSQQVMNNQSSQTMLINQLINQNSRMPMNQSQSERRLNNNRGGSYRMWQPPQVDQLMNTKASGYIPSRSNKNRRNTTSFLTRAAGYSYNPPAVTESHQQNRLKPKRYISKKKFNSNSKSAPFAPRNTTSFLIRAKKAGGITSLVSPCPVTPAVLPTPIFSPSREVLGDMAKEEWGIDGYGSMKGLIRLRSPGNDDDDDEGGSSESDVEEHGQEDEQEHLEVERRLDHDLSRFEMVYPNNGGSDHNSYLLESRVDDQDTHIARLEEENLMLKERLFYMEREFKNLKTRLQSLEMQRRAGRGFVEEVVENCSEDESGSRGCGRSVDENSELLEENKNQNVDNQESDNGGKGLEALKADVLMEAKIEDDKKNTVDDQESVNVAADVDMEGNKTEDDNMNSVDDQESDNGLQGLEGLKGVNLAADVHMEGNKIEDDNKNLIMVERD